MGAYQNPEQVKDYTMDVAKAWSNATNTVVEGIVKLGDKKTNFYEAKVKEYTENKKLVKKEQQSLYNNIDKMAEGYGGANFRKTFDPLVQKYADISLRLKNNTSDDESKDMADLAKLEGMIGLTKKGIEVQMSYKKDFNKAYETGGNPGGFDVVQATAGKNNIMNHLQGVYGQLSTTSKDIELVYAEDDKDRTGIPIDVKFISKGTLGGKEWSGEVAATALQKSNDFGVELLTTTPDASKQLGEQLATTTLVQKINVTNQDGTVTPKVIGPADNFYTQTMEKSGKGVGGMVNEQKVGKFNEAEYIKSLMTDKVFQSNVQGYLANPQKVAALMNSTGFRRPGDGEGYTAENVVGKEAEFTKRLAEYYAAQQPKERLMLNELGQPVTMQRKMSPQEAIDERVSIELEKSPWEPKQKVKEISTSSGATIIVTKVEKSDKNPNGFTTKVSK